MANPNISAALTLEQKSAVKSSLNTAKTTMNFTINLTPKERKTLFKMGPKSVSFVELALRVAKEQPSILPAGFSVTEFEKDVKLSSDLLEISAILLPLAEAVSDTLLGVGSEAMAQGNRVYDLVKNAAKYDSNLNEIKKQLGERYKKSRSKTEKPQ